MSLNITSAGTVRKLLDRWSVLCPGDPFLEFESEDGSVTSLTYGQMHERALRAAGLLNSLGVEPGDRVLVHMPNRAEFFDAWFGCAVLGAVMVPTNPLLTRAELSFEIAHSGTVVAVTTPELEASVQAARAETDLTQVIATGADMDERLAAADGYRGEGPADRDPAAILYTSGTTSRPKGVVVTNANYIYAGEVVAGHLRIRGDDRWLVVLPLFHANAQYYSTMSALVSGASVAVMGRFSATRWSDQASRHGVTLASLFAAPIRMILAAEASSRDSDNALRAVIFSQNVSEGQLSEFEERFGVGLLQLYGMTETIAPPVINPLNGERRNMSLGRPTLPSWLKLIDGEGREVPVGEPGELLVGGEQGLSLMDGYLDDPVATAEALRDGWLHTGDLARADADGYLYFVDRAKDMIKRAGENVSAGEIEAVVNGHPAVLESAAIGVPDEMRDEAIRLFCVLRDGGRATEGDILEWCREYLAGFKIPRDVRFVTTLPRTSVGKVQKEALRNSMGDEGTDVKEKG
ncbi:MAG: AMP-binding protein [Actinobacteria bacterium]|nr:AMP-binding protein [Actinomycetota bacterium]